MKRIFPFVILLLPGALSSCKKKNVNPDNPPAGSGYNQNDTALSIQSGRITMRIPAGVLKEGTKVSSSSSNVAFIDTADILHQFRLLPEGTTFKKPVTLTFHYDKTWLNGHSPFDIGIAYKNDKDGQWYPAVNGTVDTVNHTISIKTKHFSHWTMFNCFHLYMKMDDQLSEDGSQTIRMKPGDIAFLLLTMDEPPAWKSDPDKNKYFSDPLVAPLSTPQIDPKEAYQRSLIPDEWDVNAIPDGDEHNGIIRPVNGAHEHLYQYIAPAEPPAEGAVTISAWIRYKQPGSLLLLQQVKIEDNPEWELDLSTTLKSNPLFILAKVTTKAKATIFFHMNYDNGYLYMDSANCKPTVNIINSMPPPDAHITSYSIKEDKHSYHYDTGVIGKIDDKTGDLIFSFHPIVKDNSVAIHSCTDLYVDNPCQTTTDPGTGPDELVLEQVPEKDGFSKMYYDETDDNGNTHISKLYLAKMK